MEEGREEEEEERKQEGGKKGVMEGKGNVNPVRLKVRGALWSGRDGEAVPLKTKSRSSVFCGYRLLFLSLFIYSFNFLDFLLVSLKRNIIYIFFFHWFYFLFFIFLLLFSCFFFYVFIYLFSLLVR